MISTDKVTEIFCLAHDFCEIFNAELKKSLLPKDTTKKRRNRKSKLSDAEVITILVGGILLYAEEAIHKYRNRTR